MDFFENSYNYICRGKEIEGGDTMNQFQLALLLTLKDLLTVVVGPIIVQVTVELFKKWLHKNKS